jgi:hypothetical protein
MYAYGVGDESQGSANVSEWVPSAASASVMSAK